MLKWFLNRCGFHYNIRYEENGIVKEKEYKSDNFEELKKKLKFKYPHGDFELSEMQTCNKLHPKQVLAQIKKYCEQKNAGPNCIPELNVILGMINSPLCCFSMSQSDLEDRQ